MDPEGAVRAQIASVRFGWLQAPDEDSTIAVSVIAKKFFIDISSSNL